MYIRGGNRDSVEQRGKQMDNVASLPLTNSECRVLLLYFDHISDLSVLHDSVALVKMICMVTERSRNANPLLHCRRASKHRHSPLICMKPSDIPLLTALHINNSDVPASGFLHFRNIFPVRVPQ